MNINIQKLIYILFVSLMMALLFNSCMSAGTHGSIKAYGYMTSKYNLQKVIENIITSSKTIRLDTVRNYSIDVTNNRNDTVFNDYYNNGYIYVTIYIQDQNSNNQYIFRYSGDKSYWDTSKISYISIAYANDKDGNGGSVGNGGINWYNWALKKRLLRPFESELILKIDKQLNQEHIEVK